MMHPDAEIGGEGEDVQQEVELARLRAEVERLRGALRHAICCDTCGSAASFRFDECVEAARLAGEEMD